MLTIYNPYRIVYIQRQEKGEFPPDGAMYIYKKKSGFGGVREEERQRGAGVNKAS